MKLFSIRYENICYQYYVQKLCHALFLKESFLLRIVTTFVSFILMRNCLVSSKSPRLIGWQIYTSHNLRMRIPIISSAWVLFELNLLIMFLIPSIQISKCNFSVIKGKGDDYVLPLSINEHCFAKTDLKVLVFSFKSVINLSRWNTGNFFTIKRALNKVQ